MAPSIDEIPERCRLKIARSTEPPEWLCRLDSGGYHKKMLANVLTLDRTIPSFQNSYPGELNELTALDFLFLIVFQSFDLLIELIVLRFYILEILYLLSF